MGWSRVVILTVVLLLSFAAPAGLCSGVALVPAASMLALVLICAAAAVWLGLLVLVNWWEFTSIHLRAVWGVALATTVVLRLSRASTLSLLAPLGAVSLAAALLAGVAAWLLISALSARRHDGDAIELTFPLRGGRFLVTDGGDGRRSFLVNYHYGFPGHRSSGVSQSMRYAMDVVEIGAGGGESRGLLPRRNDAFRIWDKLLVAPCGGEVVHVVNDVRDNTAFGSERPYGVGNHVVIRTGADVYVVLGHMRQGGALVVPGDLVQAGDAIGRVGNSGWTERPHLHAQAMRSATGDWWHGEPVPMRFSGRFLVRNQRVRS